jgi:hypothetical protein
MTPPPPQMTSSTNNKTYFPEPAWLNITQCLMELRPPLPLFPHPTAWALTEAGLNFHGNKGFFHSDERFKDGHPDEALFHARLWDTQLNHYSLELDEFGDEIGFGPNQPQLEALLYITGSPDLELLGWD